MTAYILIDLLSVTDVDMFSAYPSLASAAVTRCGGRYLLPRDSSIEALEGNWKPHRIVVIEFPDTERAKNWWSSAEYAEARALHHAATISNIVLVDGTPG